MEDQNTSNLFPDSLQIDQRAKQLFRAITSWCMVIVVVALISYVLKIAELLLKRPTQTIRSEGFSLGFTAGPSPAGIVIGLIIGLTLNYFLFRFASQTQKAIATHDQDRLTNGFANLKTYFIFFSILMIIVCLLALIVIPAIFS